MPILKLLQLPTSKSLLVWMLPKRALHPWACERSRYHTHYEHPDKHIKLFIAQLL